MWQDDFQLVLISPAENHAAEVGLLPALFAAGLDSLHIRKPGWSRAAVEAYLQAIPVVYHSRLVLHSHYDLALQYALRGIHLTERARQDPAIPRLLRQLPGRQVSASLHSLATLTGHRRHYAYVFLSPIFDSLSKVGYTSGFDLAEVTATLRRLAGRPGYRPRVLALGGVEARNLPLVQQVGFAGAAVLGSIWQSTDPVAAFRQLRAAGGA